MVSKDLGSRSQASDELSDSIYTERYMGLPDKNPDGYVNASISNVEGFKNVDFLLAHGSGDDNGKTLSTDFSTCPNII